MLLDVRTPTGLMFVVLGTVLVVYGAISDSVDYERSMGVNVNLGWGFIMAVFGAGLLLWRHRSAAALPPTRHHQP